MSDWRTWIDDFLDERAGFLSGLRRHLHMHPEPSREEYQTTKWVARQLAEAGIPFRIPASGRGVLAGAVEPTSEPVIALRADMDALRIQDEKDVPYRSAKDGLMHACGHDAHTAIVLGAALALQHAQARMSRPPAWRAIFQPAEESGDGAAEMVAAGAMEDVRAIVALHVDPEREAGQVAARVGPMTASCSEIHVTVKGLGGHAARPHATRDPIAAAVQFLSAVSQTVPRSVDSRDPVVVTFGAITGGQSANVIPDRVLIRGTIRTFRRSLSEEVEERLRSIAQAVGAMTGTTIEIQSLPGPDAVHNDPAVTGVLCQAAAEVVGPAQVADLPLASLGGEDFAAYLPHAPGSLLRLGVAAPDATAWPMLHTPRFDIDERALVLGARILARAVILLADHVASWDNESS